jgi:hypothetical protein
MPVHEILEPYEAVPLWPFRESPFLFRFYSPERSFFDKTWVLPDIEKI